MCEQKTARSKQSNKVIQNIGDLFESSLLYMHHVPAKQSLKFNYDFIGTIQYPIDNLREQVFFMFGLVSDKNKKNFNFDGKPFELSPNLCRMYDSNFEVGFERKHLPTFYYLGNSLDTLNQVNVNRYLTHENSEVFFGNKTKAQFFNQLKVKLSIERLTLALNDDYLSQVYQTEIVRLTCDCLSLGVEQLKLSGQDSSFSGQQLHRKMLVNMSCTHFQLDNQMFDLELDESFSSQKYDFPVIFLPREVSKVWVLLKIKHLKIFTEQKSIICLIHSIRLLAYIVLTAKILRLKTPPPGKN